MERIVAARTWAERAGKDAIGVLGPLLEDDEPRVRREVAWALLREGDWAGIDLLMPLLSGRGDERYLLLEELSEASDPRALDALMDALRSADPWVREGAVQAFGEREDRAFLLPLAGRLASEVRGEREAAAILLTSGPRAAPEGLSIALRAHLSNPDPWVRQWTISAAAHHVAQDLTLDVVVALEDPDPAVRRAAGWFVQQVAPGLDPGHAADGLARAARIELLGELGAPVGAREVAGSLDDPDRYVQACAARALLRIGKVVWMAQEGDPVEVAREWWSRNRDDPLWDAGRE